MAKTIPCAVVYLSQVNIQIISYHDSLTEGFVEWERVWLAEQVSTRKKTSVVELDSHLQPIQKIVNTPCKQYQTVPNYGYKPKGFPFKTSPTHVVLSNLGDINSQIVLQYSHNESSAFRTFRKLWELYGRGKKVHVWLEKLL